MRLWLAAAIIAGAWLLALAYYSESSGFDCYPDCSTSQELAGIAVTVLPVVFVIVLIVAIVRSVARRLNR